ncbi:MAG: hypothetical protein IPN71_13120 [Fibrobacteres bacterium]|nr:hypothetical protein [Fibrobacterota bacterium]
MTFYTSDQDSSSVRSPIASEISSGVRRRRLWRVPVRRYWTAATARFSTSGSAKWSRFPTNHTQPTVWKRHEPPVPTESNLSKFTQSEWFDEDLETDYADVKAPVASVNASKLTTYPALVPGTLTLEAVIDVDGFLNWLAVNTAVHNWDTWEPFPQLLPLQRLRHFRHGSAPTTSPSASI